MMSGLVSPKSIGLKKIEEIYKLAKQSKKLFSLCKWNDERIIAIFAFSFSFWLFETNCSTFKILVFELPHGLLFALNIHNIYCMNM
jgi:hypothetical protein